MEYPLGNTAVVQGEWPILQLEDVSKVYPTGSGDFTALAAVTLEVNQGEFLGVVGKSGAGKTTLLNMISGVSEVTQGRVLYHPPANGRSPSDVKEMDLTALSEDNLALWRGENLGIVYQSFELLPSIDLLNNVMMPQDFAGQYQKRISPEHAMHLLDIVELTNHAYKLPAHISGGQKQRVAIARALVNDPPLIVADEPTGNLDTVTAETIFGIFEKLVAQGKTVIMVTHDHSLASRFTRKLTISDGVLVTGHSFEKAAVAAKQAAGDVDASDERPVDELLDLPQVIVPEANGHSGATFDANQPAIILRDVVKTYENAAGKFTALKGIDLQLHYGQFISIVGKSGSGKSTLLNMLTGIDHPSSGDVVIGGQDIYKLTESERSHWRGRNMGIVFQFFQLLPTLTLLENVMLPMDFCDIYPTGERPQRALELLRMVGLEDHANDLPGAVSNGQQQSAAIARSIATDPPIIVADEPTGNLDSRSARAVINMFKELAARGKTILIVTHDPSITRLTDQTVIISDGEIIDKTVAAALPMLDHPLMLRATQRAERRAYQPGEAIISQNEPMDYFFMVVDGDIDVVINRPGAPELNVARLGAGQFFGEVELMGDGLSVAAVRAAKDGPVELALLPRDEFLELIEESPSTEEALARIADDRRTENKSHREAVR